MLNSEKLNLQSVEDYKYLRQSNCYSITGVDDAEEFRIVTVYYFSLHNDDLHQYRFILYDIFISHELFNTVANFQDALDVVHISKGDQDNVFAMLAAVLWLGNISFTVIDNENHVQAVEDEGKNFHNMESTA